MDANSLRTLLVVGAAAIVVVINFPLRHTARSISRCATKVVAGHESRQARASWSGPHDRLARLPWSEMTSAARRELAVVPVCDTSRYAADRTRRFR
jgi:hypothetical protein